MSRFALFLVIASAVTFVALSLVMRMWRDRSGPPASATGGAPVGRTRRQRVRLVVPLVAGVAYLGWAALEISRGGASSDADPVRAVALVCLAAVFLLVGGLEARSQRRSRG